jgi:hypothetical protein
MHARTCASVPARAHMPKVGAHNRLAAHLATEPADDDPYSILHLYAALLEVEQLVLPNLGGGRLVLHHRAGLAHLHDRGGRRGFQLLGGT